VLSKEFLERVKGFLQLFIRLTSEGAANIMYQPLPIPHIETDMLGSGQLGLTLFWF